MLSNTDGTGDNFSFRNTVHSALVRAIVQLQQRSRLMQHLSEKCDFRASQFCQVGQKHKLFEVAY